MSFLDSLANAVTAFRTFAELQTACQNGYCPTIYQETRRKRLLTRVLNSCGFSVYAGNSKWMR